MKNFYLTLFLLILFLVSIFPQKKFGRDGEMRERMSQLEKIKLIEVLEMNEETTLLFFSRRAEFQKQHEEMRNNIDSKIDNLEATLKSARLVTEVELQSMIDEILDLHLAFEAKRADYIKTLNDILTTDQVARYVVFEKRFKDELRRLLLHQRKPNRQN
ncbi:MAG: hypothetical protein KJN64_03060 [Ignavibacteria bacterium]|nr:hypothetical protein [Ignavibacteria bacterium]MBT8382532.1 hypothetical protein [Ignavibacteria bacterium]MBT8390850.1 hypothetical protein [Ignavibacteria bacterium]NNJ53953.1 hypothetical protein [Ignavibacteriaceae bacterium]